MVTLIGAMLLSFKHWQCQLGKQTKMGSWMPPKLQCTDGEKSQTPPKHNVFSVKESVHTNKKRLTRDERKKKRLRLLVTKRD